MGNEKLVEALIDKCLKDIGNGYGKVLAGHAAAWFDENVKDTMSNSEWGKLLCDFTTHLKDGGYLIGH